MEVDEMKDIDEAQYKEILSKLEDQHLAETVDKSDEWKVLKRAWKQIYDTTQQQYNAIDHTQPDAVLKAMQCQIALEFYENVLQATIDRYKTIGQEAYSHAKEQGWLNSMMMWMKSNF